MTPVVLDFETFFDRKSGYSLDKLNTEPYCRDPRFEAHGCAIKLAPNKPAFWVPQQHLKTVFARIDWPNTFLIHHHAHFDGLIMTHHYGVHPGMWGCTLSEARLLLGNHLRVGLDAVRKHFGMPSKQTPYHLFEGKHWNELSPTVQKLVGDGACDEVESIWKIFCEFAKIFPQEEYEIVDSTIRLFTEPKLIGDGAMLKAVWEAEENRKTDAAANLGVDPSELRSDAKFAELLRAEGIEPETKEGKKEINYAFAKNDQQMRDLREHENERVRDLVEARLGEKSNIMQKRASAIGWMASRGPLCVYINYAGAHTTRDSGGDGTNFTNLKRTDPDSPKEASPLRKAIMAPDGYRLAIADLSQIECRILNYLAGQNDVIEKFSRGEDPYVGIASAFYGRPITTADKEERGTGKQAELSCGFGCGPPKFKATAKLGIYGPPVYLTDEESARFVKLYRSTHPAVCAPNVGYWAQAGRNIARVAGGEPLEWGPMLIRDKKVYGPGGTMLHYESLEYHIPTEEECEKLDEFKWKGFWRFRTRDGWTELYHTKFVENVVQWLARIVWSQALIRIRRRGYHIAMRTYDEFVALVPKGTQEDALLRGIVDEMKVTPSWLPGIPLECEGHLADRYVK